MLKRFLAVTAVICALALPIGDAVAQSREDAGPGWSNSLDFSGEGAKNARFGRALNQKLLKDKLLGNRTTIYSTSNSTTNVDCREKGACQQGGDATNINGYSENNISVDNSDGVNVDIGTDITAESEQSAGTGTFTADEQTNNITAE